MTTQPGARARVSGGASPERRRVHEEEPRARARRRCSGSKMAEALTTQEEVVRLLHGFFSFFLLTHDSG